MERTSGSEGGKLCALFCRKFSKKKKTCFEMNCQLTLVFDKRKLLLLIISSTLITDFKHAHFIVQAKKKTFMSWNLKHRSPEHDLPIE